MEHKERSAANALQYLSNAVVDALSVQSLTDAPDEEIKHLIRSTSTMLAPFQQDIRAQHLVDAMVRIMRCVNKARLARRYVPTHKCPLPLAMMRANHHAGLFHGREDKEQHALWVKVVMGAEPVDKQKSPETCEQLEADIKRREAEDAERPPGF
jgi:hypothetical protein